MSTSLKEYLDQKQTQDTAFEAYQNLPCIDTREGQQALCDLSEDVATIVGRLIYVNACLHCGKSLGSWDTVCDRCGESNDSVYDLL